MSQTLKRAYKIIFETEPEAGTEDWQIAEKIMGGFDIRKLGEDLAKEVVFSVVLDVRFPNKEITNRVVLKAEGLASELWDDLPDEVHMADLERKRYLERSRKNRETEKELTPR